MANVRNWPTALVRRPSPDAALHAFLEHERQHCDSMAQRETGHFAPFDVANA